MATQQTTVFNGALVGAAENLSSWFDNGIGFYLIAPGASVEYQVNVYLQVQLSNTITRMVRLNPSNVSNTERITLIPSSLVQLGLPMRLAIVPSGSFNLEVILISADCPCTEAIEQKIDDLQEQIFNLEQEQSLKNLLIEQTLSLILNALGISVPVLSATMSGENQSQYFNTGFV